MKVTDNLVTANTPTRPTSSSEAAGPSIIRKPLSRVAESTELPAVLSVLLGSVLAVTAAVKGGPFGAYGGASNVLTDGMSTASCYLDPSKDSYAQWKLFAETAMPRAITTALIAAFPKQDNDWENMPKSLGKYFATMGLALVLCQVVTKIVTPMLNNKKPEGYNFTLSNLRDNDNLEVGQKAKSFAVGTLASTIPVALSDSALGGLVEAMPPSIIGAADGALLGTYLNVLENVFNPESSNKDTGESFRDLALGTTVSCIGDMALQLLYPKIKDNPISGIATMVAATFIATDIARYGINKSLKGESATDEFEEPNITHMVIKKFKALKRQHDMPESGESLQSAISDCREAYDAIRDDIG